MNVLCVLLNTIAMHCIGAEEGHKAVIGGKGYDGVLLAENGVYLVAASNYVGIEIAIEIAFR